LPFLHGLWLLEPLTNSILFYGVIPIATIILFKEPLKNFGITFGKVKKVIIYSIVVSILLAPIIFVGSLLPSISNYYMSVTITSFESFVSSELRIGFFMFFWELFFRGFILFGLFNRIGNSALPIHAVPFALFHLGKPDIEVLASFFAAILFGIIALKSKSFLPAFIIHWIVHAQVIYYTNFT